MFGILVYKCACTSKLTSLKEEQFIVQNLPPQSNVLFLLFKLLRRVNLTTGLQVTSHEDLELASAFNIDDNHGYRGME